MINKPAEKTVKNFAVFYADRMSTRSSLVDLKAEDSKSMTLRNFHDNYVYVGTFKGASADSIFQTLQDGGGNLGVQCSRETGEAVPETMASGRMMQELLMAKIGHTSMSTGDIVVDLSTCETMMCASFGWTKLEIVGLREPVEA